MKTVIDFIDRVFQILTESGFADSVEGIYTDPDISTPGKEFVLITSPGMSAIHDVVDTADVTVNLIIVDVKGSSDVRRFRYLISELEAVLTNYDSHKEAFVQYGKNDAGQKVTVKSVTGNEYFHIKLVWADGIYHDPKRQGYSYYSIRTTCWIEK